MAGGTAQQRAQATAALAKANEIRINRAAMKRKLRAGDLLPDEVIDDPPECALTMTIGELLRAQDRWGRERVRKLLLLVEVHELRTLERLTERQRGGLIAALEEKRRRRR